MTPAPAGLGSSGRSGPPVYWRREPTRSPRGSSDRSPRRPRVPVGGCGGSRRGDARQRPASSPPGGPPEPGRQLPGLVPRRLARRTGRVDRAVPLPRAHDVQGDADVRARGPFEAGRDGGRPGQRLHEPRRHRVPRDRRSRAARPRARARGRPDAASSPRPPRGRRRAEGRDGGAPDTHGGRPGRSPRRALQHRRLRGPPLSAADDRARPGHRAPDGERPSGLVRGLLPAQQRDRRRRRGLPGGRAPREDPDPVRRYSPGPRPAACRRGGARAARRAASLAAERGAAPRRLRGLSGAQSPIGGRLPSRGPVDGPVGRADVAALSAARVRGAARPRGRR